MYLEPVCPVFLWYFTFQEKVQSQQGSVEFEVSLREGVFGHA